MQHLGSRVPCGYSSESVAQLRMLRLVLGRIDPLLFLFATVHPYPPRSRFTVRVCRRFPSQPCRMSTGAIAWNRRASHRTHRRFTAGHTVGPPLAGHLRLADFDLSVKLTRGQRRFSFVCARRPSRASIHQPRRAGAKAEVPQRWLLAACRSARRSTCLPRSCTAKATTLALIGGGWAS